jgi:serine/threonine-protein kinase
MLVEERNNKETCYPFKKIYEKPSSTSKKFEISQTSNSNKKKLDETDQLLDLDYANGIFKKENPKFLENFELLESIKAGSSGAVIKVKSKNIRAREKILALKVLPNKREKSQQDLSKKFLEAVIHKKLHNNNIPEVYALYQVGKNYSCMLLEYNKYGDLSNFKKNVIKRECLSESLICYIAGGILNALKYLNKKKILHLDIKPQNILVDDFLNIKVTDYSVSLFYGNEKEINLPMAGTCYYMSPEVLKRKKIQAIDASKIDIYSFGVLLYLLAFNDYPYELDQVKNDDYSGIYNNIKEKNVEFPKDTGHSEMFKNFVKKCLEKDINKRYNIYQAMNDPWMKGYNMILDEKENLYNAGKFMIEMLVDNIKPFNDYIKM